MKTGMKVIGAIAMTVALVILASCAPQAVTYSAGEVAGAAKQLRSLIPGIQAGLALAKPYSPTSRAFDPNPLVAPAGWTYGLNTPEYVYTHEPNTGGTIQLPAGSGNYYTYSDGTQVYFTLTPESALGTGYYRILLYTYPAFDLSVAYTIEEYIVNSNGTVPWPWGNLSLTKAPNSYVSLTTVYTDGTSGVRTLIWNSNNTGSFFTTFSVPEPDPASIPSFVGYRYEESNNALSLLTSGMRYSSHVTEYIKGKGTVVDAIQYYTETDLTHHSGLTYVAKDKKRKWSVNTYMVTRMEEDTTPGSVTKTIRSVVEVGTSQYYIDKVNITMPGGQIAYVSTHDVYDTALPRGVDARAHEGTALTLDEDGAGAGTFTGTLEEVVGSTKTVRDVTISKDSLNRFLMKMKFKSTGARALGNEVQVLLTVQDLSNLSIALPDVNGTFTGYYEAGSLFGAVSAGGSTYDVVVADEGVAVDEVLYP